MIDTPQRLAAFGAAYEAIDAWLVTDKMRDGSSLADVGSGSLNRLVKEITKRFTMPADESSWTPAWVVHPGEILAEEVIERDWSLNDLARHSQLGEGMLREVLTKERRITTVIARGLALAFGTSHAIWLNLQKMWDEALESQRNVAEPGEYVTRLLEKS